jgi:hypothetical protein
MFLRDVFFYAEPDRAATLGILGEDDDLHVIDKQRH